MNFLLFTTLLTFKRYISLATEDKHAGERMPLYSVLAFIGIVPIATAAFVVYKNRSGRGAHELFLYTITLFLWLLFAGIEDLMKEMSSILLFAKLGYLGYVCNPFFLLLFTLQYSGVKRTISPRLYGVLLIAPVLMLIATFTNDFHGLVWPNITMGDNNSCHFEHGPIFYIFNILVFIATLLSISFVVTLFVSEKPARIQGWVMMIGFSFQWWAGLLYITGWNPFPGYDIVAMSGVFPALAILYGIYFADLFKNYPIRYRDLFATFDYGYLILNREGQILESNEKAKTLLSTLLSEIPSTLSELSIQIPHLSNCFNKNKQIKETGTVQITDNLMASITFFEDEQLYLIKVQQKHEHTPALNTPPQKEVRLSDTLLIDQLNRLLKTEKLYRNSALTLESVAILLNTNRTYLSQAINAIHGMRFTTLINKYRIEHFTNEALESNGIFTIEALSQSAGFQQKSTFYKAFKAQMGISPSQWISENTKA